MSDYGERAYGLKYDSDDNPPVSITGEGNPGLVEKTFKFVFPELYERAFRGLLFDIMIDGMRQANREK